MSGFLYKRSSSTPLQTTTSAVADAAPQPDNSLLVAQLLQQDPELSEEHQRIIERAAQFDAGELGFESQGFGDTFVEGTEHLTGWNPSHALSGGLGSVLDGVESWTGVDMPDGPSGDLMGRSRGEYGQHTVDTLQPVIADAASMYNIPVELIEAILLTEAGGDEYLKKSGGHETLNWARGKGAEKTSLGLGGMQIRRGAESLGYLERGAADTSLDDGVYDAVRDSLNDPVQSIYLLAKHLSDIRDALAFDHGTEPNASVPLGEQELSQIGTLYHLGMPDLERADTPEELVDYMSDAYHSLGYGEHINNTVQHRREARSGG